jgi:hemerythrin
MALMNWSAEYSVEVPTFDREHQQLFGMLNELHDGMRAGQGKQVAPNILKRLVEYTQQHFAAEESAMKRTAYANFVVHKIEHDKLTAQVLKMAQEYEQGKIALSMALVDFLRDWLKSHIMSSDKKYSQHMSSAGVR